MHNHADGVRVGDIVTCEGMSAIRGEVTEIGDDGVVVRWMSVQTTEIVDDLIIVAKAKPVLDEESLRTLNERQLKGGEALRIAWNGRMPAGDDQESAARDTISNVLTYLYGPAAYYSTSDGETFKREDDGDTGQNARDLLDSAMRSYEGDAEDYTSWIQ